MLKSLRAVAGVPNRRQRGGLQDAECITASIENSVTFPFDADPYSYTATCLAATCRQQPSTGGLMPGKRLSNSRSHSLTRYLREIPAYRSSYAGSGDNVSETDSDAGKNPEELILSNLGFVVKIAGGYRNRGVPFEDLLNEGNIGLIQAAFRYDHGRGVRFECYAAWWIRKMLRTALDEQGLTIRVPEYQRRKTARLMAVDEALQEKHGHHRSDPRCDQCGPAPQALRLRRLSLQTEGNDEHHGDLLDTLVDHSVPDPLRDMMNREDTAGLRQSLTRLSGIEREVIERRFGLDGEEAGTLKEVGAVLGLSRERIRQIEEKAKEKLRSNLRRHVRNEACSPSVLSRPARHAVGTAPDRGTVREFPRSSASDS